MLGLRESTDRADPHVSKHPSRPGWAQPFATALQALLLSALLVISPWPGLQVGLLLASPEPVLALNDAQAEVVEVWSLVNQSYVDPARLEAVQWRRLRQKTLERPIETSEQAYAAIDAMLAPIGDPYTRLLRPSDYGALRSNTRGTVSGVGLQLALRGDGPGERLRIVVVAPLDG